MDCAFGDHHLIDLKSSSNLDLSHSIIENNSGLKTLIRVSFGSAMNLTEVVFRNNVVRREEMPSCIMSEKEGKINLFKCEFINHISKNDMESGLIIENQGILDIMSTIFEENKTKKDDLPSIKVFYLLTSCHV